MSLTGLVAVLGQRSILSAVTATFIALCMRPLLWRWCNPALMAHFEIVLALIFYFTCMQQCSALRHLTIGAPLLILALWTNPYSLSPWEASSSQRPVRRWLIAG
jgi:hypothetical protein